MNLGIIGGSKSDVMKSSILSERDNIGIEIFTTVEEFKMYVQHRSIVFDRVLLTSLVVKDNPMSILPDLYSFMQKYSPATRVVFMLTDKDREVGEFFDSVFESPTYTSMIVVSVTSVTLSSAIADDISVLNAKYGTSKTTVSKGVVEISQVSDAKVERVESSTTIAVPADEPKVKKKGFFGGLFKGKDAKAGIVAVETPILEVKEENLPDSTQTDEGGVESVDFSSFEIPYVDSAVEIPVPLEIPIVVPVEIPIVVPIEIPVVPVPVEIPVVVEDIATGVEPCVKKEEEYVSFKYTKPVELSEEVEEVDVSFDLVLGQGEIKTNIVQSDEVLEVDTHFDIVFINQGREQMFPAAVIKEVFVNSKSGSESIINKSEKAIFLVTGDRRSGVTSTALSLVELFRAKVKVLYIDFDVERHGVLGYIDFNSVLKFDEARLDGLKFCKSAKSYDYTVIPYEHNFDLLTSRYETVVTDEDIRVVQSTVSDALKSYDVIVIDAPINVLNLLEDIFISANVIVCSEYSHVGFLNTCLSLERSTLVDRCKRKIVGSGALLLTHGDGTLESAEPLLKGVHNVLDFGDSIDWLGMSVILPVAALDFKVVDRILGGI